MEETTAMIERQPFPGEDWFDPLEMAVRGRIRGFIEEMLEAELESALQRGRYDRHGPKAVPGRFESGFPGVTNRQSLGAIRFAEERHAQGLFIGFARACDRSG